MLIDTKKVYKLGGAHAITLPIDWVKSHLDNMENVNIVYEKGEMLIVFPEKMSNKTLIDVLRKIDNLSIRQLLEKMRVKRGDNNAKQQQKI